MLRTKVVCTLGPATSDSEVIADMVRWGMNVARLNMAHGDHSGHAKMIEAVRSAGRELQQPVAILADLCGPKIRVGELGGPRELVPGDRVVITAEDHAAKDQIPTTYPELVDDLDEGVRVAIDVEYIGMSFVRTASDVSDLKTRVEGRALVVAKIEMARALATIDEILDVADLVMIARGDLGVELPFEKVPLAQKRIIQEANFHGRPVITATQMLESMIEHSRPTRAEASDVANAVLDGTDAVMLSGETAMGNYPLLALDAIVRIVREIESSGVLASGPRYLGSPGHQDRAGASPTEHAVALGTVDAVRHLEAPAVLVLTSSGFSARLISSHRPPVPIFGVTTDPRTYSQLSAVWGVRPVLAPSQGVSYKSLTDFGKAAILESGIGSAGQSIVVTAGVPFHRPGTTNTLRVERL
jgi:pyruvate kinase